MATESKHEFSTQLQLLSLLLLAVIATPKIPLFGLDAAFTVVRLDTLVSIMFSMVSVIYLVINKPRVAALLLMMFLLYAGILNINSKFPAALLSAIYASSFTASLLVSMELGSISGKLKIGRWSLFNLVFFLVVINSFSGFLSLISGYEICRDVSYADVETSRCIFDRYGYTGAPYIFGAYAVSLVCMAALKRSFMFVGVGLLGLVLSDSRSYFIAFMPIAFYLLIKSKLGWRVYLLSLVSLASLPFIDTKVVSGVGVEQLGDDSLGMRLIIFNDFMDWLDPIKISIGGGANAFFEFATQYGMPGHPDNVYVRIISEIGVLGLILFFSILGAHMFSKLKTTHTKNTPVLLFFMGLLLLGLGQESMLAVKSGHVLLFLLGVFSGLVFNGFPRWLNGKTNKPHKNNMVNGGHGLSVS